MPLPDNPYLDSVGLYLTGDSPEFERAARWWTERAQHSIAHGFDSTSGMLRPARQYADKSLNRLVVFAHGTTTGLGRPGKWGVDTRPARWGRPGGRFISPDDFAAAWAPKLAPGALVALAACLCSRSPHWYLIKLYGSAVSPWGPEAYRSGGARSTSAAICAAFLEQGRRVRVRGHCAAGHTIHQALIRQHEPGEAKGTSLFEIVHGHDFAPTPAARRTWQDVVKGELAASYLLGMGAELHLLDRIREGVDSLDD